MAQTNRLKVAGEDEPVELITDPPKPAPPRAPSPPREVAAITSMLMMALKALSQRTIIALASLVDMALAASVFVLWVLVIAQPTTLQLVGLGGYAAFVLAVLALRTRAG